MAMLLNENQTCLNVTNTLGGIKFEQSKSFALASTVIQHDIRMKLMEWETGSTADTGKEIIL